MIMKHAYELLAIESVNALFWNFTSDDIRTLKAEFKDFAHIWDYYIDNKGGEEAFNALWEFWMTKFNVETKLGIIEYALVIYGEEKKEDLDNAYRMRGFWDRLGGGDL